MFEVECGVPDGHVKLQRIGPTLSVHIGFDASYKPDSGGRPNVASELYRALVDTGATASCIDSSLARTLDLPVVDRQLVSGVHGAQEVNLHLAQIY